MSLEPCPQCGGTDRLSRPITVTPAQYATFQAERWPDTYTGIETAEGDTDDGIPVIRATIDQTAYETHNFFKHRNSYEAKSATEVHDLDDGTVEIRYPNAITTVTAWRCKTCDCVYDEVLGVLQAGTV